MNDRRDFIPQFKKNGEPKKGYSEWGERLGNIEMRKKRSEYLLSEKRVEFKNEYHSLDCVHCGSTIVKKIYLYDSIHFAKYECVKCYRNLKWVSKFER